MQTISYRMRRFFLDLILIKQRAKLNAIKLVSLKYIAKIRMHRFKPDNLNSNELVITKLQPQKLEKDRLDLKRSVPYNKILAQEGKKADDFSEGKIKFNIEVSKNCTKPIQFIDVHIKEVEKYEDREHSIASDTLNAQLDENYPNKLFSFIEPSFQVQNAESLKSEKSVYKNTKFGNNLSPYDASKNVISHSDYTLVENDQKIVPLENKSQLTNTKSEQFLQNIPRYYVDEPKNYLNLTKKNDNKPAVNCSSMDKSELNSIVEANMSLSKQNVPIRNQVVNIKMSKIREHNAILREAEYAEKMQQSKEFHKSTSFQRKYENEDSVFEDDRKLGSSGKFEKIL